MNLLDIVILTLFARRSQKKAEQSYYECLSRYNREHWPMYNNGFENFNHDLETKVPKNKFIAAWEKKREIERKKRLANERKIKNLTLEETTSFIKQYCIQFGLEFVSYDSELLILIDRSDVRDVRKIIARVEISPKLDTLFFKEIIDNQSYSE